jgi:catechol 2,3-dioxygenase-like lactoylglutathione lyase family enzyme
MADATITGIDHVQVAVPPKVEDECRAFYVRLLGMEELVKPPILAARGGIWVKAGTQELHCGVEADFQPARKAHPAFAVAHLDDLARRVSAAGHNVAWDDTNPALRRFFTHDPFGNRLEFVEANPPGK